MDAECPQCCLFEIVEKKAKVVTMLVALLRGESQLGGKYTSLHDK